MDLVIAKGIQNLDQEGASRHARIRLHIGKHTYIDVEFQRHFYTGSNGVGSNQRQNGQVRFQGCVGNLAFYGLVVCPWYAYSQTMINEATPLPQMFLFFALFSIVGKTSAFIGPLVSSAIITASGNNDNMSFAFLFTLCHQYLSKL